MLIQILKFNLKNLAAERSLYVVAAIFAALLGYGAWNGSAWVQHQRSTLESIRAEQEKRLAALPDRMHRAATDNLPSFQDPRMPGVVGGREGVPYLTLPPRETAALAIGQSDLYPYYLKASTQSATNVLSADEIENPDNLLFGRFDLAFVLVYLYPLLILALSYNILSAEREQGTLALTMSQPVRLATVVFGKLASRGVILVSLALLVAMVVMQTSGGRVWSAEFLLWTGVLIVYSAFWFALAVVVNAAGKSSAANAVTVCACWAALALIVPSALHMLAGALYPVPSRVEMIQTMHEASKDAAARGSAVLAKYLEDHPELTSGGAKNAADAASKALAVQQETERLMAPVLARFDQQLDGQRALLNRLRFLSPAILAQGAMNDLAGSGTERFEHFRQQVNAFLITWRGHFAGFVLAKKMLTPSDVAALPRFVFEDESPSAPIGRILSALLGILAPTMLLSFLGLTMVRRYRVQG
ncbi:MAG TPA: DUF3526 domain-containing protein [Bryobacteraceae bacterium]|nr:DUF3526 domain-containing protein [Bryobacteraceae bacterium]